MKSQVQFVYFHSRKCNLKMSSGKWRPFCLGLNVLTHLPLVPHICVSELDQYCFRCQTISWTNTDLLSIRTLWTNFSEIRIKIQNVSFMKMRLTMSSAKWWPFCPGEMSQLLIPYQIYQLHREPIMWRVDRRPLLGPLSRYPAILVNIRCNIFEERVPIGWIQRVAS